MDLERYRQIVARIAAREPAAPIGCGGCGAQDRYACACILSNNWKRPPTDCAGGPSRAQRQSGAAIREYEGLSWSAY